MSLLVIIGLIYFATIAFIIFLVIKNNGEPLKTISWILVLLLIPVLGMIVYFFLGNNLRRNKLLNTKEYMDSLTSNHFSDTDLQSLSDNILSQIDNHDHNIIKLLTNNSSANISMNNKIELIIDGKDIYKSVLNDLMAAKDHIHMNFFRILPGEVWNQFLKVLEKKAAEGVKVRIIYDDVGSWDIKMSYARKLKEKGIEMLPFMPVFLSRFANKLNYRNHRKIVVVDGKIAYTGGFNIADHYIYGKPKLGSWHDVAIRIEGEAVHAVQKVFLIDWNFVKREPIKIPTSFFPEINVKGNCPVQIVKSGPDSDWSTIMQSYFYAIISSQKYVYLSTPYFLPNESILTALKTAALSTRKVKLLIPYRGDSAIVSYATHSYISELLDAGIEVYLFKKGFNHGKYIIVDGRMCSIGTANIDIRSFDHDFEINAFIYDNKISQQLEKMFISHTEQSLKLTVKSWNKRSKSTKFMNSFSRILSPMF